MKIKTLSIIAGNSNCNASCPFCVSKMTPLNGMEKGAKEPEVNWRNFRIACKFAEKSEVTTAMITGKGEPTLFPNQISLYLKELAEFDSFPFIEMQTNGIAIARNLPKYDTFLKEWYGRGMTTVALSIVHYTKEKNKTIYTPNSEYIDLPKLIEKLHETGLCVRLTCIAAKGFIDSVKELTELMKFAKENKVEQVTLIPVNRPNESENESVSNWVNENYIRKEKFEEIKNFVAKNGKELLILPHGAIIYDLDNQNLCLSNCLTIQPDSENIRQLIFFPDGHLRYDWQYSGAIIL